MSSFYYYVYLSILYLPEWNDEAEIFMQEGLQAEQCKLAKVSEYIGMYACMYVK